MGEAAGVAAASEGAGVAAGVAAASEGAGVGVGVAAGSVGAGEATAAGSVGAGVGVAAGSVGVAVGAKIADTARKSNSAVCLICSAICCWLTPGTLTTIAALSPDPWVVTSASATPKALTRCRMISTDCLRATSVTGPASPIGRGTRITWVPPRRSNPSLGAWSVPGQKAQVNMPMSRRARASSVRPGRYRRGGVMAG